MTAQQTSGESSSKAARLRARIDDLTAQIDKHTEGSNRRLKLIVFLGTILVVACIFSMGGLTSMTRKLDAKTVAEIGRAQLQAQLPSGRIKLQHHLEQEAPRIVASVLYAMLDQLPAIRNHLVHGFNSKLDGFNTDFERKTVALMDVAVREGKAELDKAFPKMSDREKLEKLVEIVARRFNEKIAFATDELYPAYESEMDKIKSYLELLKTQDPAKLTKEDRIKKEIVETLLHLIARQEQKQD